MAVYELHRFAERQRAREAARRRTTGAAGESLEPEQAIEGAEAAPVLDDAADVGSEETDGSEPTEDGKLVQLHLKGDDSGFETLYRLYFERLVRLCRARGKDQVAAEDLAQETLIRALGSLERFQLDRPMWPWLKTIATRLIIDQSRGRHLELVPDPEDGEIYLDDTVAIEERPLLSAALQALPPRQRVALALRYLDDWSPAEAAEALGMSRPAFDQLLFRARGKLRKEYRRASAERARAPLGPRRLEVALWPVLLVAGWLRGLGARVRDALGQLRGGVEQIAGPLQLSGQGLASVVAAATLSAASAGAGLSVPGAGGPGDGPEPSPLAAGEAGSVRAGAPALGAGGWTVAASSDRSDSFDGSQSSRAEPWWLGAGADWVTTVVAASTSAVPLLAVAPHPVVHPVALAGVPGAVVLDPPALSWAEIRAHTNVPREGTAGAKARAATAEAPATPDSSGRTEPPAAAPDRSSETAASDGSEAPAASEAPAGPEAAAAPEAPDKTADAEQPAGGGAEAAALGSVPDDEPAPQATTASVALPSPTPA